MATVVLKCNCRHDFQDGRYNGKRLHNIMKNGLQARCTVCETVRDIPGARSGAAIAKAEGTE